MLPWQLMATCHFPDSPHKNISDVLCEFDLVFKVPRKLGLLL